MTFMEQTRGAAPTKEFLVAHPAFILLAAAAMTRLRPCYCHKLAAAIGQL